MAKSLRIFSSFMTVGPARGGNLRRRIRDLEATSLRQRLTYFYRHGKEIIKEKLKLIYTC